MIDENTPITINKNQSRRSSRGDKSSGKRSARSSIGGVDRSNYSDNLNLSDISCHRSFSPSRRVSADTATLLSLVDDISYTHEQLR